MNKILTELRKGPSDLSWYRREDHANKYRDSADAIRIGFAKPLPDGRLAWINYEPLEEQVPAVAESLVKATWKWRLLKFQEPSESDVALFAEIEREDPAFKKAFLEAAFKTKYDEPDIAKTLDHWSYEAELNSRWGITETRFLLAEQLAECFPKKERGQVSKTLLLVLEEIERREKTVQRPASRAAIPSGC